MSDHYTHMHTHTHSKSISLSCPVTPSQASLVSCDRLIAENIWTTHSAAVPKVMWSSPCGPEYWLVCVCVCVSVSVCWSSNCLMLIACLLQTPHHANFCKSFNLFYDECLSVCLSIRPEREQERSCCCFFVLSVCIFSLFVRTDWRYSCTKQSF